MSTTGSRNETATLGTSLRQAVIWSDKKTELKDFASSNTLPGLALIVKGRYRNIGSATTSSTSGIADGSSKDLNGSCSNVVFIQSVNEGNKILMEAVKQHPGGRHVIATGRKFSLPLTYRGWFEVLSEDGRPCRPLSSIAELAQLWPRECVVRENVRALVSGPVNNAQSSIAATTRLERLRNILAGEKLTLHDEVRVIVETQPGKASSSAPPARRYLRCIDEQGNTVFFNFEQKASISPVAGPDNISGVHNIMSLLDKFRLPLTVHLVCGYIPPKIDKSFTSIFRLLGLYEDVTAFVLPLRSSPNEIHRSENQKSASGGSRTDSSMITTGNGSSMIQAAGRMLSISTREPLVLVGAANAAALESRPDFVAIRRRCDAMVAGYANSIHVLVSDMQPDHDALARGADRLRAVQNAMIGDGDEVRDVYQDGGTVDEETEIIFDEIDDIYRYVREGGDPPPPRTALRQLAARSSKQASNTKDTWVMRFAVDMTDDKYEDDEVTYESIIKTPDGTKATSQRSTTAINDRHSTGNNRDNTAVVLAEEHDNFWEEPIYADIEEIRERKRITTTAGDEPSGQLKTGSMKPSTAANSVALKDNVLLTGCDSPQPNNAPKTTRPADAELIPVGNLRQLLKRFSCNDTSQIGLNQAQSRSAFARSQFAQEPVDVDRKQETVEHLANDTHRLLISPPTYTEVLTQTTDVEVLASPSQTTSIPSSSTTSMTPETDAVNSNMTMTPSSPTVGHNKQALHHPTCAPTSFTSTTGMSGSIRSRPLVILNRLSSDSGADYKVDHREKLQLDLQVESGEMSSSTDEPAPVVSTSARQRDMNNGSSSIPGQPFGSHSLDMSDTAFDGSMLPSSPRAAGCTPSVQSSNIPTYETVRGVATRLLPAMVPVAGTTSVVVSRRPGPRLVQQHQYHAPTSSDAPVVAAGPSASSAAHHFSRVAVSGNAPVLVLHNNNSLTSNVNEVHQPAGLQQPMNVTRISTLSRRYKTHSNEDRSQSAA